jgi:transcriptional regulator with XRE-family HTH domain
MAIETPAPAAPQPALGVSLRALREARGLSLHEVAAATGISASFLSLVENAKSDITLGRLTRLVAFFGVSIADLLPAATRADAHVVRRDEARLLHSPAEGIDVYLLTPDTTHAMMPMYLAFEPAAKLAEYGRHAGQEFVYVVEGSLALELEGAETRLLRAGDSAYYRGEHPHSFHNPDPHNPLRLVCVDSPPPL